MEMNGWIIQRLGERIDSFNQDEFKSDMEGVLEKGALLVALDLQNTKFLSFPCIQMIVAWAGRLRSQGGRMMLIAPSEKLKRQIFIYGSLDHLIVTKAQDSVSEDGASELTPVNDQTPTPPTDESPELDGNLDF